MLDEVLIIQKKEKMGLDFENHNFLNSLSQIFTMFDEIFKWKVIEGFW